ncbi:efflux RND transporter periplasmic adaptor subunit [Aquabacterium soli]|uniref:Efflux RND transporter periplasmic adaptor subunit n=1 Tax=Aquabacterium soli TaxID=2493092 RepID=A0A3R8TRL3_9BURK|nr:efflux RND transporter periplasmic adaptor subunit [Aquabacterium soli]RRS03255.1 efflux RND transporter periplasmic adaptor subunit [Aquabacterium soli]
MAEPAPPSSSSKTASPALSQLRIDRGGASANRRRGPHWGLWATGAIVVAAGAAWLLSPRAVPVQTAAVVSTTPSQQYVELTASGYVVAQRRAAVASKATGRLVELMVREGSKVKKGEIIARLDASDVQAAIAAAEAGVRQAEAGLRQAQVESTNAQAELVRSKGLQAQGFISPQAVDTVQTRANAAQASVAAAQASIAAAQAQRKVQQVNQDFTEIRAPFDGVVLVKNANVGDIITPFSNAAGSQGAVLTMADMSTLEVEADVSESSLGKARIGQPVEIVLDALPNVRFRGTVGGIVPTVDRAKATVMTKIRFDQLDPRVLPEMSAKVSFLSRPVSDADQKPVLGVNAQAVVEREGGKAVWRITTTGPADAPVMTASPVAVKTGRIIGEVLEITPVTADAIKSGDKVVLAPPSKLREGATVKQAEK